MRLAREFFFVSFVDGFDEFWCWSVYWFSFFFLSKTLFAFRRGFLKHKQVWRVKNLFPEGRKLCLWTNEKSSHFPLTSRARDKANKCSSFFFLHFVMIFFKNRIACNHWLKLVKIWRLGLNLITAQLSQWSNESKSKSQISSRFFLLFQNRFPFDRNFKTCSNCRQVIMWVTWIKLKRTSQTNPTKNTFCCLF